MGNVAVKTLWSVPNALHHHPIMKTTSATAEAGDMADYILNLRKRLVRELSHGEILEIAQVIKTTTFVEVPFLIWALLGKSPKNLFLVHRYVDNIMVLLASRSSEERDAYMATHKNTVDATKFPVHAHLVEVGALRFSVKQNRFLWAD